MILPFLTPKRGNSFCEALYLLALLANRELLALATALIEAYLNREPRLIERAEVLDQACIPNLEARLEIARVRYRALA